MNFPLEINEMIAEKCNLKTLFKLRLVSKSMYYAIDNILLSKNRKICYYIDKFNNGISKNLQTEILIDLVGKMTAGDVVIDKHCQAIDFKLYYNDILKTQRLNENDTLNMLMTRQFKEYVEYGAPRDLLTSYLIMLLIQMQNIKKELLATDGLDFLNILDEFGNAFYDIKKSMSYKMVHHKLVKRKHIEQVSQFYVTGDMLEYMIYNNIIIDFSSAKLYGRIGYYQLKNYADLCIKKNNYITKYIYDTIKTFLNERNITMYQNLMKYEKQIVEKKIRLTSLENGRKITVRNREYIQFKQLHEHEYKIQYAKIYYSLFV